MSVIKALSSQRLTAYRRSPQEPDDLVIRRYLWNMQLSESLYPVLHTLEVTLRNYIHASFCASFGNNWLQNSHRLEVREREAVEKAKDTLTRQTKTLDHGHLIAELNFGFWTSLFDKRYEQVFWPAHLRSTFPAIPRTIRTRHTLSARLNHIRKLRNHIFHYEPIWHWKDLSQQHAEILETIEWMSPDISKAIQTIDRFQTVHASQREF